VRQAGERQIHPAAEAIKIQPHCAWSAGAQQRGGLIGSELSRTRLGEHPVLHQVAQHARQSLRVGPGTFGQVGKHGALSGAVIGHEVGEPQCRGDPKRHRGH